jgi:hypothetical protein
MDPGDFQDRCLTQPLPTAAQAFRGAYLTSLTIPRARGIIRTMRGEGGEPPKRPTRPRALQQWQQQSNPPVHFLRRSELPADPWCRFCYARTAEDKSAKSNGVNKSAKVVLERNKKRRVASVLRGVICSGW